MKLTDAPTADILAEIKRFQSAQKRAACPEIHADIGRTLLAPLFAEMARRQKANGGEVDCRKWK